MAPYRWQLDARIRRAQALLIGTSASLDEAEPVIGRAFARPVGIAMTALH
jgi:AraC family transcriptional regulator